MPDRPAAFQWLIFYSTRFGIREFTHEGTQFSVNGKKVILRGDALLHEKYMYRMGLSLYSREDWVKVLKDLQRIWHQLSALSYPLPPERCV